MGHKELYEMAEDLNVKLAEFSHHYDETLDAENATVYLNDTIESAIETMRNLVEIMKREIVADAFAEGEVVFLAPIQKEVVEGYENVHRGQRMVEPSSSNLDNLVETFGRSPVRMMSPL